MDNNYHYYSYADFLTGKVAEQLYILFPEDDYEYILTRKHYILTKLSNLMGFRCGRAEAIISLQTELTQLKDKTWGWNNSEDLHNLIDELLGLIKTYQKQENIRID